MIFKAILIGFHILSMIITIFDIDKPRKTITRGNAVVSLIISGIIIYGFIYWL